MSAAVAAGTTARPRPPGGALAACNPLALLAAVLPLILAVMLTRELAAPLMLLVLALAAIAFGARVPRAWRIPVFLGPPLVVLTVSVFYGLSIDPGRVADTPALITVGGWSYRLGALLTGVALGLRLAAALALAAIPGVAASPERIVRAAVQWLRVPYRIGYVGLVAMRFVPTFGDELATITAAHRVRGEAGGRGPFGWAARRIDRVVPLIAGALRRADRAALAMDARAFGAHRTRTERHPEPLRARDAVFVVTAWTVGAAVLVWAQPLLALPLPTVDKWT